VLRATRCEGPCGGGDGVVHGCSEPAWGVGACTRHAVHMPCACSAHAACMQCTCRVHAVHMPRACSAHAATLRPCEKRGEEGASQLSRRTLGAVLVSGRSRTDVNLRACWVHCMLTY